MRRKASMWKWTGVLRTREKIFEALLFALSAFGGGLRLLGGGLRLLLLSLALLV